MATKPQKKVLPTSASPGSEPQSELILYQAEDGKTKIEVRLQADTVWLTQKQMSELFQKDVRTINEHIQNIFEERELSQDSVIRKFRITAADGKGYETMHYNLDVAISVGYRVKSHRGTQFRIWATQRLKEYIVKGFTLDDERLKKRGGDHFDELLERIREIRASERNFYQKIKDIYTTSEDYDPHADVTIDFFAMAQNKIHWAIHGHTAAELIAERADASKPNMGLTSWSGAKVRKADVHVAKNYLNKEELELLNLIVNQYLEFAEFQARTRKRMYMRDWVRKLDDFLRLNDRDILTGLGKISSQLAKEKADRQFAKFDEERRQLEDAQAAEEFAKEVEELENKAKEFTEPPPED
ncbi:MAG: virulence RhuM family protein [Verrucomicrobia bacterium]|nr:virulence RhuM family protein [Verrucomicrobiota bacterium]